MSIAAMLTVTALSIGIPPELLKGVCWVESNHNPKAHREKDGHSPSYGLCQVKLGTARMFDKSITSEELRDPKVNAAFAAKYLKKQLERYDGNWSCAVIAYNRGNAKNVCRLFDRFSLSRNTVYSSKVLNAVKEKPWNVGAHFNSRTHRRPTSLSTAAR